MTDIEQRAIQARDNEVKHRNVDFMGDYWFTQGYIQGATDQQKIDDKELSDALFIQRQMLIDKAVKHIMVTPAYAVQPEVYAEGVKKAMMKGE